MTDDQNPPESEPSMNALLKAARGHTHIEPRPLTDLDISRALRAGFGRAVPDNASADAGADAPAPGHASDYGGGPRGETAVSAPKPTMNDLLRSARPRRDIFGGLGAALHLEEED